MGMTSNCGRKLGTFARSNQRISKSSTRSGRNMARRRETAFKRSFEPTELLEGFPICTTPALVGVEAHLTCFSQSLNALCSYRKLLCSFEGGLRLFPLRRGIAGLLLHTRLQQKGPGLRRGLLI
jgi:hypothetical protein